MDKKILSVLAEMGIDASGMDADGIKNALQTKMANVATDTAAEITAREQKRLEEMEANHKRVLSDSSVADEQLRIRNRELEEELAISRVMDSEAATASEKEIIRNWVKANKVKLRPNGHVDRTGLRFGEKEVFSVNGLLRQIRESVGSGSDAPVQVVGKKSYNTGPQGQKIIETKTKKNGNQVVVSEMYDDGTHGIVRWENGEKKVTVIDPRFVEKWQA